MHENITEVITVLFQWINHHRPGCPLGDVSKPQTAISWVIAIRYWNRVFDIEVWNITICFPYKLAVTDHSNILPPHLENSLHRYKNNHILKGTCNEFIEMIKTDCLFFDNIFIWKDNLRTRCVLKMMKFF